MARPALFRIANSIHHSKQLHYDSKTNSVSIIFQQCGKIAFVHRTECVISSGRKCFAKQTHAIVLVWVFKQKRRQRQRQIRNPITESLRDIWRCVFSPPQIVCCNTREQSEYFVLFIIIAQKVLPPECVLHLALQVVSNWKHFNLLFEHVGSSRLSGEQQKKIHNNTKFKYLIHFDNWCELAVESGRQCSHRSIHSHNRLQTLQNCARWTRPNGKMALFTQPRIWRTTDTKCGVICGPQQGAQKRCQTFSLINGWSLIRKHSRVNIVREHSIRTKSITNFVIRLSNVNVASVADQTQHLAQWHPFLWAKKSDSRKINGTQITMMKYLLK